MFGEMRKDGWGEFSEIVEERGRKGVIVIEVMFVVEIGFEVIAHFYLFE